MDKRLNKTLCGVGYIGVGEFQSTVDGVKTIAYTTWNHMITRCYSSNTNKKYLTYKDCTVDEEWHNFQNFCKWFELNYREGYCLDKDILQKGNKIYGPDTCCFVPQSINKLFVKANRKRGKYPLGINEKNGCLHVNITRYGKLEYLGSYDTVEDAFGIYKKAKECHIKTVAYKSRGLIDDKVLEAMLKYQVEIDD